MLIEVDDLAKSYRSGGLLGDRVRVAAVDGVSFRIDRGETLGLVGESGSGKSTIGRLLLRLVEPDRGRILFDGDEIQNLGTRQLRAFRPRMQMVFQNPLGSMNPVYSVNATLRDAVRAIRTLERDGDEYVGRLLEQVGLNPRLLTRFRTEMSGGQLQRVSIARALASRPEFLFLDEPTSALDLSVRGQIVNLLIELQERERLTYLFVSHDLSVVRFIAHRVIVVYRGRIVESAPKDAIFDHSAHPYTELLLNAAKFDIDDAAKDAATTAGDPSQTERGCRFHDRCPHVEPRCRLDEPPLIQIDAEHHARCWLVE